MNELVSVLVAHDAARSAGLNSTTSGQAALANMTALVKQQLKDSITSISGSHHTRPDRTTPSVYGNRAIVDGQVNILAKLDRIEQLHIKQDAASVDRASISSGLNQLRRTLRHTLAPFVADFDDFAAANPTLPIDSFDISVPVAFAIVSDYCATHSLASPHYSYAPRAAVPSCHRFNGSLTGGVCTVQLGTPADKLLGGVITARGTGVDAGAARASAYVALAKALKWGARGGAEVAVANGERLGLAEARAFLGWYCARFHFAPPAIEQSQSGMHDPVPGVWHATLSIAGRRIGMGEALDRDEATARAKLDTVSYLHAQDEALWEAWVGEKHADAALKTEMGDKIDEVVAKWETDWLK